jgi:hypothetical protein
MGEGEVRVKFGRGETQDVPLAWAEMMLMAWQEKKPAEFGRFLSEAAMAAK